MDGVEALMSCVLVGLVAFTLWMMVGYINSSHNLYLIEKELIQRGDMMYCPTTGVLDWTENCDD